MNHVTEAGKKQVSSSRPALHNPFLLVRPQSPTLRRITQCYQQWIKGDISQSDPNRDIETMASHVSGVLGCSQGGLYMPGTQNGAGTEIL